MSERITRAIPAEGVWWTRTDSPDGARERTYWRNGQPCLVVKVEQINIAKPSPKPAWGVLVGWLDAGSQQSRKHEFGPYYDRDIAYAVADAVGIGVHTQVDAKHISEIPADEERREEPKS